MDRHESKIRRNRCQSYQSLCIFSIIGKGRDGDWLISVDGVKLQNLASVNYFAQYLQTNSDARKVFQIKRTASFPLLSEFDVLAHAAEEAKQKPLTAPVYSQDRYRKNSNEDFRMNAAHKSIIGFTSGEEMVTESCQPMETREFMLVSSTYKVKFENVHDAEEQALLSSIERDIINCVAGAQAVEPPVPPSIKSSKQKRKRKITFDQRIGELTRLKEKYGHCDLNSSSKDYKPLGVWSENMRSTYRGQGTMRLTEDRIRRLEAIGFKWMLDASFDQRIEELKGFKEKHGHCDLNSSSKAKKSLGIWSDRMRYAHRGKRTMKLTEDRIRRLEEIGFKWILLKAKTKKTAVIDQERTSYSGEHILSTSDCSIDMHSDLDESKVEQLVEVSLGHAVNPSTDADGLADVQAADPPVSSSIKTSKQFSPGSPSFDPSRYTIEELQDSMEESKRVCREMQRRETARLDEIANRLFQSDEDESENNSDEDSADGLDDDEEYIAA